MKQRTQADAATTHRPARSLLDRLGAGRAPRPPTAAVEAELSVIADRRLADPPAPGSVRPRIRAVTEEDRRALEEMALRCSGDTLRRRFHAPVGHMGVTRVVGHLHDRGAVLSLVADVGGAVVAVGSLHRTRSGDADIAVLVEDAWQSGGVGHRMTGHLLRAAGERGIAFVVADVLREPSFLVEHLGRVTADTTVSFDGPVATVRIPVASLAA